MTTSLQRHVQARPRVRHTEDTCFRELLEPLEVVESLRLRHRIYFEEQQYGPAKALRLDLTAHDARSRLFGVFQAGQLVGGVRLVFRREQPLAALFRALREVAEAEPEQTSTQLPSEEAFDFSTSLGAARELVDAEVGRLALDARAVAPWLISRVMLATLAAVEREGCRLYLYSCATSLAKRYARISNPRVVLEPYSERGIASDDFVFPKPTVAAIAAVPESPYAGVIEGYAAQLQERGVIDLSSAID